MAFENLKSTGIAYLLGKLKGVFLQIKDAVKTVNGERPGESGNITITTVPYSQNLQSELSQTSDEDFIERTAGGSAPVNTGNAWLISMKGNSEHTGYVAESIEAEVESMSETPITVTVDRDTFVSYVATSGTTTITYSSGWSTDPAVYGVTVTGTPMDGDQIVITYVKEERGTITAANPQSMISTGWNLYNHSNTYARVLDYGGSFGVSGTYTKLRFSATVSGTKSNITVTNGLFTVPSDGYVWVTGGNATDTAIWMAWNDWTSGYSGSFETYAEEEIDFSEVMSTYFPYGLLRAGSVRDEINLSVQEVVNRVERKAYSLSNRAAAEESGLEYEFDEDYIYIALEEPATNSISSLGISNKYTVNDHGTELFTQTTVPVLAHNVYGNNLKNKLEVDVLTISQQTLTTAQKSQVRSNIGALGPDDSSVTTVSDPVTWGTYSSGDAQYRSVTLKRCGKMRSLSLGFTPNSAATGWTTIATLKESADYPAIDEYAAIAVSYAATPVVKACRVMATGEIQMLSRSADSFGIAVVYFVA